MYQRKPKEETVHYHAWHLLASGRRTGGPGDDPEVFGEHMICEGCGEVRDFVAVADSRIADIRSFEWTDIPLYVHLVNEAARADGGQPVTVQEAEAYLRQPNLNPQRDLFFGEFESLVAGFVLVVPELGIGRTILETAVHPTFRDRKIGTQLMEHGIQHCRGLGAEVVHVSTGPSNEASIKLLSDLGFTEARRQWRMRLDLAGFQRPSTMEGFEIRPMQAGEEPLLTDLQNRAFSGTWGFAPNTIEENVYRVRMNGGRPEDVLFLVRSGVPIAYCWTKKRQAGNDTIGIIWMIGVDPDARGEHAGRTILIAAIDRLASAGAREIELTVYADNAPAVRLYHNLGFTQAGTILWYERKL